MRRRIGSALLLLAVWPAAGAASGTRAAIVEEHATVPLFGKVTVYRPEPIRETRGVVLFVSGDGGWNKGVVDMARRIAPRAIVAGLSMPLWQKVAEKSASRCWFPAGELESVAQALEKTYALPRYLHPILVGYSSGATMVYGALAQAPPTTFAGAVSLGFCPDIEVARPFCSHGEFKPSYDAKKHRTDLPAFDGLASRPGSGPRWIALQGEIDQVCAPEATRRYVEPIPGAKIVMLPKVGHGFSVPRNWGAAFDEALASLLETTSPWEPLPPKARHVVPNVSPAEIGRSLEALDLPLEVQWPAGAREALIFVSGDGGWADLDQSIASALYERGVAVVGWSSLRYFWEAKTPDRFRSDLARVAGALPQDVRLYAGGYSFGAEVVPVALGAGGGKLPADLGRIAGMVLVGPGPYASFEVSPLDWIRSSETPTTVPVREALALGAPVPVLCMEAASDEETGCPSEAGRGVVTAKLPGGHHFGGDFASIAKRILEFMGSSPAP